MDFTLHVAQLLSSQSSFNYCKYLVNSACPYLYWLFLQFSWRPKTIKWSLPTIWDILHPHNYQNSIDRTALNQKFVSPPWPTSKHPSFCLQQLHRSLALTQLSTPKKVLQHCCMFAMFATPILTPSFLHRVACMAVPSSYFFFLFLTILEIELRSLCILWPLALIFISNPSTLLLRYMGTLTPQIN